jgi:hypothetical protein
MAKPRIDASANATRMRWSSGERSSACLSTLAASMVEPQVRWRRYRPRMYRSRATGSAGASRFGMGRAIRTAAIAAAASSPTFMKSRASAEKRCAQS